jgi:hypothetical protein
MRCPVRLNFRLIRGRSGAAGTVRRVSSCLVTHGPDLRRTGSSRLGKRVGETLKSSNLLSSANGLTRQDVSEAVARHAVFTHYADSWLSTREMRSMRVADGVTFPAA